MYGQIAKIYQYHHFIKHKNYTIVIMIYILPKCCQVCKLEHSEVQISQL